MDRRLIPLALALALVIGVFFWLSKRSGGSSDDAYERELGGMLPAARLPDPDDPPALGTADYTWSVTDMDGVTVSFEKFRGKVVLLNVWATWCPPCRAEMPTLQALFERIDDPRVAFAFVSNEPIETLRRYRNRNDYTMPFYTLSGPLPRAFAADAIPRTFIVDREGRIVFDEVGAADWSRPEAVAFLETLAE